jgi:hypothetical protein
LMCRPLGERLASIGLQRVLIGVAAIHIAMAAGYLAGL